MNPRKTTIDRWLCAPVILAITIYQHTLSPLLGNCCRFYPSCSHYSMEAFRKRPFLSACWLSAVRIVKCNPFHPGGYDPLDPNEVSGDQRVCPAGHPQKNSTANIRENH